MSSLAFNSSDAPSVLFFPSGEENGSGSFFSAGSSSGEVRRLSMSSIRSSRPSSLSTAACSRGAASRLNGTKTPSGGGGQVGPDIRKPPGGPLGGPPGGPPGGPLGGPPVGPLGGGGPPGGPLGGGGAPGGPLGGGPLGLADCRRGPSICAERCDLASDPGKGGTPALRGDGVWAATASSSSASAPMKKCCAGVSTGGSADDNFGSGSCGDSFFVSFLRQHLPHREQHLKEQQRQRKGRRSTRHINNTRGFITHLNKRSVLSLRRTAKEVNLHTSRSL
mmetsp:Transcript_25358/g.46219  ORF Transcript_25358/g.46219 Transcript_25358/m.46219 type:complete len:278 (+) Transcript_25358:500-1333(+)